MLRESQSVSFTTPSLSDRLLKQNPDQPRRPLSAIEYRARVDLGQDQPLHPFGRTSNLISTSSSNEDVDMTDVPLTDEQQQLRRDIIADSARASMVEEREREIMAERNAYQQARNRRARRSVIGGGAVTDGTFGQGMGSGSSGESNSAATFFRDNDD